MIYAQHLLEFITAWIASIPLVN